MNRQDYIRLNNSFRHAVTFSRERLRLLGKEITTLYENNKSGRTIRPSKQHQLQDCAF